MNGLKYAVVLSMGFGIVSAAEGADFEPGKNIAATVCAACHGANGISVSDRFPNLAGQRRPYIEKQLKAFKSKKRKHGMMNGIAGALSKADMANVAAFYASQPGAQAGAANSKPPAGYIAKRVKLPASLSGFVHYMTFNHKGRKQLRKVYANRIAIQAAKAGEQLPDGSVIVVEQFKAKLGPDKKPVVGADGFYVSTKRVGFTAMERQAGWGDDFPETIRNGNWHYGVFKADRSARPNVSQASCLSCHKPFAADSFLFTIKQLRVAANK